ncbi:MULTISPECIES: hypothetical protein [unclassified Rhizobacter]|uniref:hypothetical protein n=1 Tax=unclassified Rhizobacter TaxID=2640088 RepID=UPI0006FDB347|nr:MULTISPECIES: hypothetical protein [unclassified Rhizobacter]KQU74924.1 hypothetical protein ASC88_26285 [Rhizobacter sp. Root29]KQW01001.1 hypothetical protein ASC98_06680 [Rhizobacter sp. Root1238]KRB03851.1 hypothetical protein ASE08_14185 [Rhizobacter sp. Root16D2]
MNFPKVTFDTRRALADFDGDADSIAEVLLAFLEDLDTGRTALEDAPARGRAAYAAVLHELANSLESIWCFDAGRRVREIERSCHRGEVLDTALVQHEVSQLLEASADEAREWLRQRFS